MTITGGEPSDPSGTADPFRTAAIRQRVLDAWSASPARFREDANAEEDAALGAYRDRLVVELLQNAVDAAAGSPCRVLLTLTSTPSPGCPFGLFEAANTGAPLTAAGVEALSTLRASAKRDGDPAGRPTVGRFGVGFAAVLAVSDTPSVRSRTTGAVGWSRARTLEAATELGSLSGELRRRDGAVPVLRLPFPAGPAGTGLTGTELTDGPVPDGYDTVVRLPLRDAAAADTARRLLAAVDPTLPLVLPGLADVTIDLDGDRRTLSTTWDAAAPPGTEVAELDGRTWRGVVRRGAVPAALLADRPVEERARSGYEVRAMVCDGGWPAGIARVLRAPQPTDEPLSLPVLLSVELPLEPSRRHTVAGPLRDWLLDRAAEAVVDLAVHLADLPPAEPVTQDAQRVDMNDLDNWLVAPRETSRLFPSLTLVPTGLAIGEVDGRLREAVRRLIAGAPVLPGGRAGADCAVLDAGPPSAALARLIAPAVDGLLPAELGASTWTATLTVLGVRRLGIADAVDLLGTLTRPPAWWGEVYAELSDVADRDALGALPVPLATREDDAAYDDSALGFRMVTGPRGLLLPMGELDVPALVRSGLDLRVVHPDACSGAAGDLLRTLGAVESTPRGVLGDPAVQDAVTDPDGLDPGLATAVLSLVRGARLDAAEVTARFGWLTSLPLPDVRGDLVAAGELLMPGGPLARVVADDAPFSVLDPEVAAAWPPEVLEAIGVLSTFAVLRAADVTVDADDPVLFDLDDSDQWVNEVTYDADLPPVIAEFAAVRDLELVADDAWPDALAELALPPLRTVVAGPEPSYTRWWLARHTLLPAGDDLLPPSDLLLPGADPELTGLYEAVEPPPGVDAEFLRLLGCRSRVDDILADVDATLDLLDRLGDSDRDVPWAGARALYVAAAEVLDDLDEPVAPPLTVRTPEGVVPAADAVVVDAPDVLALLGGRGGLRVPLASAALVARVLELSLVSELLPGVTFDGGARTAIAPDGTPYFVHDALTVEDLGGQPTRVPWRVIDGTIHLDAGAGPDDLARALAWKARRWDRRHAIAADLRDPDGAAGRLVEADLDPSDPGQWVR